MLDLRCCNARMDSERDRIIFLGLAALYQVAEQSRAAPVQPSLLLRATLAALYGHSDGNRAPYEAFWRSSRMTPLSPSARLRGHIRGARRPRPHGTGLCSGPASGLASISWMRSTGRRMGLVPLRDMRPAAPAKPLLRWKAGQIFAGPYWGVIGVKRRNTPKCTCDRHFSVWVSRCSRAGGMPGLGG